jgi:CelD/BcsL family acetyltransferase involved in cellulose biosynthesis
MLQHARRLDTASRDGIEVRSQRLSLPERSTATGVTVRPVARPSFIAPAALIAEWDELATRAQATPYLRPGWMEAWWLAFGKGDLQIRTLYRKGRLAALMPVAEYHGALRSASNYHSPRAGLLAEDLSAAMELARTLYAAEPPRVSVTSLDPASGSYKALSWAAESAGYRAVARPFQCSPYLDIGCEWPEYEAGLSDALKFDLRRARSRLARQGRISIDIVSGRGAADEPLKEAFATEASGWKGTRGSAILSSPNTRNFYTNVARWAANRGYLRLFFLRLGKQPLAVYYALQDRGTCYLLKGGYDVAYRRYSPGKLLLHAVIEYCFAAHLSRVEFHGDAEPYKFLWARAVHEQKRFEAFQPTAAGKLTWATLAYVKPAAKRILTRFGLDNRFTE